MMRAVVLALASTTIVGCAQPGENCTLEARASGSVEVEDEAGAPLDDATVVFSVDGGDLEACEHLGDNRWACGFEQEGEIHIEVSADGYADQERTFTVGKTDDGCHVEGESLTFTMIPATPT